MGFLLICFLSGCAKSILYKDLSQEDANKVMVLLQQQGIAANLEQEIRQNEVFWSVTVEKPDLPRAREIIVTSHVISPRSPGLKEIYQDKGGGWIKTPAEERARYLLAQKGEIVNALKKLPKVIDVDVILNLPEQDDLGKKTQQRPTASVVIKAEMPAEGESALAEIEIQKIVSNALPEMSPRDVAVLLNFVAPLGKRVEPGQTVLLPLKSEDSSQDQILDVSGKKTVQLMGLKLDQDSRGRLKLYLIIFFVVLVLLSVALVIAIIQGSRTRQELKSLRQGNSQPALEGQVMDEPAQLPEGPDEEE
ncbi:MAG: hypothetical protein Q7S68_02460 [Deltaproteobacteria bacterium]|nr:hypothetical protein [Deltaproteobacteria bacterium]